MSFDSLAQYQISKTLEYTDWHPPIMSWIWSRLNDAVDGPQGLLAFHLTLLWAGLYLLYQKYEKRRLAWLIIAAGFLPWVINFSGVLWKDVGMAVSLLMMVALGGSSLSRSKMLLMALAAFYAVNLRYNAIFAVGPILYLFMRWQGQLSIKWSAISSLGALAALVFAGSILNYQILGATKTNPSNYIMVDDLLFLSVHSGQSLIPGVSIEDLQQCAQNEIGKTKLVGKSFCLAEKPTYRGNPVLGDSLKSIWLRQLVLHPISYLAYRLSAFSYLIRSPAHSPYYIWHPGVDENNLNLKQRRTQATNLLERYVYGTAKLMPFAFKPYWWLWIGSLLLLMTLTMQPSPSLRDIRTLLFSGLLYTLGYLPLTPMADFRYVYWSVMAITLAGLIWMIERPVYVKPTKRAANTLATIGIIITLFIFCLNMLALKEIKAPSL